MTEPDPDLVDMSDERLTKEFDRLASLKDQCASEMFLIRTEQARRKSAEIERLQAELDGLKV